MIDFNLPHDPQPTIFLIRERNQAEARQKSAVVNVMERLEYFGINVIDAYRHGKSMDNETLKHEADELVKAVLAITRGEN